MSETEAKTTLKNDVRLVSNQESASAVAVAEGSGAQSSTTVKELVVGENVTAVVTKAKRAATFLWTLLHAQVRITINTDFAFFILLNHVPVRQNFKTHKNCLVLYFYQVCKCDAGQCHHPGCNDAKQILLHINACPAKAEFACPNSINGCQQSRKLMSHYRKCREARARQRRQGRLNKQTNACLICTLLARHDKTISESSLSIISPLPPIPQKTQKRANQTHSLSTSFDKIYSPQVNRRKARSKSVQFDLNRETKLDSPIAMPPPPPRSRTLSVGSMNTSMSCYDEHFASGRKYPFSMKHANRPRSESMEERKMPSPSFNNDPTVELELERRFDESRETRKSQRQLPLRKRSVSCSLIPDEKFTKGCDTIMEE
jgi:hypothetical protein